MQPTDNPLPMSRRDQRKAFKKEVGRVTRLTLVYMLMYFVTLIIYAILAAFRDTGMTPEVLTERMQQNIGALAVISALLGLAFAMRYRGRSQLVDDVIKRNQNMEPRAFLTFIVCLGGAQGAFLLITGGLEMLSNALGYTLAPAIEASSRTRQGGVVFWYAVLLAPVIEEIVFRGAILRALEPRGKLFAMLVSSALFGLLHGNLVQGLFAFIFGLLAAYVVLTYSLKWAIALHIANNLILSWAMTTLGELLWPGLALVVVLTLSIAALIKLIQNRHRISAFIRENRTNDGRLYRWALSSIWVLLLILLSVLQTLLLVKRL